MHPIYFLFPIATFFFCGVTTAIGLLCVHVVNYAQDKKTWIRAFTYSLVALIVVGLVAAWVGYIMIIIDYGHMLKESGKLL